MFSGYFRLNRLVYVAGFCLLLTNTVLGSLLRGGQVRTREEILKEAGRLVTDAERVRAEAFKKVGRGGDRKLIRDANLIVAESLVKAIELWRAVGHDTRLILGIEELTRIYFITGDYDRAVERLTTEAEFWRTRGNLSQQTRTLWSLGIRQMQMKRTAAAIETFERVVDMSHSLRLYGLENNVLTQLLQLYDKVGNFKGADSSRERAKLLQNLTDPESPRIDLQQPPEVIPAQWVDLPNAPLGAEYREVDGTNRAVLVNRSAKGIEGVTVGCVTLENNGKTSVLYGLMGLSLNHGGVRPGDYYRPFLILNGPLNRWTDEKMLCEGPAKMALIAVEFDDRTRWKADGVDWVAR